VPGDTAPAGLILPAVAIVATPTVGRGEAAVRIPFREIALLRRIPLFAPVPAPALETAAASLVEVPMLRGQAVLREGDVGDRFYVVDAGEVTVDRHGTTVATLGPGGSFGELALIRDIPRTASVTATTDGSLLALDRAPFLLAITASPRAAAEAMRVASRRLELDAATPVPDLRS
jgi:CRP-like cAMP-binding protein